MEFPTDHRPGAKIPNDVSLVMRRVLLALIPGTLCAWWFFGVGILVNVGLCTVAALAAEAGVLRLRKRPVAFSIKDGSAIVTGALLGLALPPFAPWWIAILGTMFAIIVAKQLYGGLGFNPFNPAMAGYVVLIISFPFEMTLWAQPQGPLHHVLTVPETFGLIFGGWLPDGLSLDAVTMATPLDSIKTRLGLSETLMEIKSDPLFGNYGGTGWEWINFWFLVGGIWLLRRRVIYWQIPTGMLGALFFMAFLFYAIDPDTYSSPLFHWFSGASMLAAFFIATDPVSAATTNRGRLIYGAGIGIIVYVIRTWGGYPDGVAFAVLLMNMAAPAIDHYSRPRAYGDLRK